MKARSFYYSVCGMKFQTVSTYIRNLAYIRHLMNLEVTYQNIFLTNNMTLTQQIWSLKHFCQVFIHQDNQTFLKPVLLAMLEKL